MAVAPLLGYQFSTAQTETTTTITTTTTTTVTTTTTTYITVTNTTTTIAPEIVVANITVPQKATAKLYARYLSPDLLYIRYTCFYPYSPSDCPRALVAIYDSTANNTLVYSFNITGLACRDGVCIATANVTGAPQSALIRYALFYPDGTVESYEFHVSYPRAWANAMVQYVYSMLPFALAAGLGVRGDLRLAALGLIAGGVLEYVLGLFGLVPLSLTVSWMAIVFGAILLWVAR